MGRRSGLVEGLPGDSREGCLGPYKTFIACRSSCIAVLAFFRRYLEDHGEGGSGRFVSSRPRLKVEPVPVEPSSGDLVPLVESQIWLKPFDLAVSQAMTISVPPDPATNQYAAVISLHRLSGTREAWIRLNHGFIKLIRRQFLHWRIVGADERERLFEEAKRELLESSEPSTGEQSGEGVGTC